MSDQTKAAGNGAGVGSGVGSGPASGGALGKIVTEKVTPEELARRKQKTFPMMLHSRLASQLKQQKHMLCRIQTNAAPGPLHPLDIAGDIG